MPLERSINSSLFSLQVSTAATEVDDVVAKGDVDYDRFVLEFRAFDWPSEIKREYWAKLSSPGIGVVHGNSGAVLWVSAYDLMTLVTPLAAPSPDPIVTYVIGLNDGPEIPNNFSLREEKELADCQFTTRNGAAVERVFYAYFRDDYDDLYQHLLALQAHSFNVE